MHEDYLAFSFPELVESPGIVVAHSLGVSIRWTGPLDWTTGLMNNVILM